MLNQLLGGRYQVVQVLGEGGIAQTYIVEDHHRPGHPQCVVKFLKPASNAPEFWPIAQRLFHQEAAILEKLGQHEQIPRSLAYFEENQKFYLVQELIEGQTLSQELIPGKPWSESQVVQMLQDVLPILEFVHSYGVIHRDLKPSNLIRRVKDGRLVLIDFGAVKQVSTLKMKNHEPLTQNTIPIGTQGYVPIEQLIGQPRLNSDIYALGMIGIQALTGVDPFYLQEDGSSELFWSEGAEVSEELAAILSKMVHSHFQDRYQSATEVKQALQALGPDYTFSQSTSATQQAKVEVAPKEEEKVSGAEGLAMLPGSVEKVGLMRRESQKRKLAILPEGKKWGYRKQMSVGLLVLAGMVWGVDYAWLRFQTSSSQKKIELKSREQVPQIDAPVTLPSPVELRETQETKSEKSPPVAKVVEQPVTLPSPVELRETQETKSEKSPPVAKVVVQPVISPPKVEQISPPHKSVVNSLPVPTIVYSPSEAITPPKNSSSKSEINSLSSRVEIDYQPNKITTRENRQIRIIRSRREQIIRKRAQIIKRREGEEDSDD